MVRWWIEKAPMTHLEEIFEFEFDKRVDRRVGSCVDMQEFYDRWSHGPDPVLHLTPSLHGCLLRSIKDIWFERAEEKEVDVGQIVLVREMVGQHTVGQDVPMTVRYLSERTERGWRRHMVAFRQGEVPPFPVRM